MTVWVDASSGASGDMLLGALLGAGVPARDAAGRAVDAVAPEPVDARTSNRSPATASPPPAATSRSPTRPPTAPGATSAPCSRGPTSTEEVRDLAERVFERLAVAEATVHGSDPLDVAFHEVGALDAIADVVGVVRRLRGSPATSAARSRSRRWRSAPASVRGAHGTMPVPPPAVAELLRGVPSYAGPAGAPATELVHADRGRPADHARHRLGSAAGDDRRARSAIGAGGRDPDGHANVLRLFTGTPAAADRAAAAHRDQHRRPRPPGVAVGDRRAARGRRLATPG